MEHERIICFNGLSLSSGPLLPRPFRSEKDRAVARGRLAGVRVLVVEDNLLVALDLIRGLQELKAELLGPVSRVQEALALISSTPPHAAVLDVNLLDGSVAPVADSLRRMGVPFVLLTGFDLPDEMKKNHPDVRAYSKPADPIQMGEKLAGLLGR